MALAATLFRAMRGYDRLLFDVAGISRDRASGVIDVVIENVSRTAFRIRPGPALGVGERITVDLFEMEPLGATVVRQTSHGYSCEFDIPLDSDTLNRLLASSAVEHSATLRARVMRIPSAERPYSRKIRMLGAIGFVITSWALIAFAIKMLV